MTRNAKNEAALRKPEENPEPSVLAAFPRPALEAMVGGWDVSVSRGWRASR